MWNSARSGIILCLASCKAWLVLSEVLPYDLQGAKLGLGLPGCIFRLAEGGREWSGVGGSSVMKHDVMMSHRSDGHQISNIIWGHSSFGAHLYGKVAFKTIEFDQKLEHPRTILPM